MNNLFDLIKNNDTEGLKKAIEEGADVNEVLDEEDTVPLHYASYLGLIEMVKLLIDNKANVNAKDRDGWTPLHDAIYKKRTEIIKLLKDAGAKDE